MSQHGETEIKWWHKAMIPIMALAMLTQIKGCLGVNTSQNPEARTSVSSIGTNKRDACSFIYGRQYPYDWEGSDIGACVIKMPPTIVTTMVPDLTGTMLVPQQQLVRNRIRIQSPIGSGIGEWNGGIGNISGKLITASGEVDFVCISKEAINSQRGICGIPQSQ